MKLGKVVAKGVAEDVLDATVDEVEEPQSAQAAGSEQEHAYETADPLTVEPLAAGSVTAGSSTER